MMEVWQPITSPTLLTALDNDRVAFIAIYKNEISSFVFSCCKINSQNNEELGSSKQDLYPQSF